MNKKFFTLIAGVFLLAASFGTAHAQYSTGKPTTTISPQLPAIGEVSERLYQLGIGATGTPTSASYLLAVEKNGDGRYYLSAADASNYDLPSTLWKISVTKNAEGALSYSFVNVQTNLPLTYVAVTGTDVSKSKAGAAVSDVSYLGGEVSLWKWQPAVKVDNYPTDKFTGKALTSAYGAKLDSAVTLATVTTLAANVSIGLAKYSLGDEPTSITNQIYLTPYDAAPVLLTPDDLNSMLWTQDAEKGKVSFSFAPNVKGSTLGNAFTTGSFKAVWAVGYPASFSALKDQHSTNPTPYDAYTGTSGTTTYTTLATAIANAEFDRDYLNHKIAFAKKIGKLVYDSRVTLGNHAGVKTKFDAAFTGLGFTPSPAMTKAIAQLETALVAAAGGSLADKLALMGPRTKAGTAANIIAEWHETKTYLAGASQFEKDLVDAVISYLENVPQQPGADPHWGIVAFGDPIELIYGALTATTLSLTEDEIASAIEGITDGFGTKWDADEVKTRETAVETAYRNAAAHEKTLKAGDRITNRWVSLLVDETKQTYLSVDTGYVTNNKDLGFKVQPFADVVAYYPTLGLDNPARLDLNGRFNYQFHYFPTQDSLVIRVGGFAKKLDNQKNWGALNILENPDLGIEKAGVHPSNLDKITDAYASTTGLYQDRNLVKLALLTNSHSEVTVGSSEFAAGQDPRTTINTLIRIGRNAVSDNRTTLKSGLYFIQLKTDAADRKQLDGAYKYRHIAASSVGLTWAHEDRAQLVNGTIQNFGFMPAAQWVVEQYPYGDGRTNLVSIYNREYPDLKVENVQLYTAGNGRLELKFSGNENVLKTADTLAITEISKTEFPEAYSNEYLGYYKEETDKYYKFDYLSGIKLGNYLKVLDSRTDSLIYVDIKDESVFFELEEVAGGYATGNYGYPATKDHAFKHLKRTAYVIRVKAPHLLFADGKYIVATGEETYTGERQYAVSGVEKAKAATFFLKENNRIASTPYFALEEANGNDVTKLWSEGDDRVSVKDGSLYLILAENYWEKRVSAFALVESDIYLYRRFDKGVYGPLTEAYGDASNAPLFLKFSKSNNPWHEFLSENSPAKGNPYRNGVTAPVSFLGLYNIDQLPESDKLSYTFYVDTAYVRGRTVMPQYMLALRPEIQKEDTLIYKGQGQWEDSRGNPITPLETTQDTVYVPSLVKGDYLFNAQDSVDAGNRDYEGKFAYGAEGLVRLAFVTGVHYLDTFYVLTDKYKTYSAQDIAGKLSILYDLPAANKHYLGANTHYLSSTKNADGEYVVNNRKSMVFQFRLIDEQDRRFLIETTRKDGQVEFGPSEGQWVKIQNGVPVISGVVNVSQAAQNGAEIFDVTDEEINENATGIEAAATVKVISETGAVTILNAAGRTVAVSNILGQTVASATLTSDNARISLPKGIVIVAVEGEAAVKAVVK
jgi:hypothetical protein